MSRLNKPLQNNDGKLFDQLSKAFDAHEYNKSIRFADSILSSNPDHGETFAMKGLALYSMEEDAKRKEGIEIINRGIAANPNATLSWHCMGLAAKGEKDVSKALLCFKKAVQLDGKNLNAMRDLSSTAVQLRDWPSFLEVRQKLLNEKSNVRAHWLALAAAHRMNGNYDLSCGILDIMIQVMDAGDNDMEKSEVHLYRAELEMLAKRPNKAIEILKVNDSQIKDVSEKNLLRAKAFGQLKQVDKSEKLWLELIAKGVSESDALLSIAKLRNIPMDDDTRLPLHNYSADSKPEVAEYCSKFVELCDTVTSKINPKCDCAKRFPLDCVPVNAFEERLRNYIKPFVLRMIPSITSILKSIYAYYPRDDERITIINKVFHEWETQLKAGDYSSFNTGSDDAKNPTLLLWVYQFLASHYMRICDFATAHKYADLAINHTPTIEMLYLLKAKICRREGNLEEAAKLADTAQMLDLQDKYINGKAAKYIMRSGDIAHAEKTMQLFMKESVSGQNDTYLTALEAQTVWYEREVGDAFFKKGDVISALQNYLMLERHNEDNHNEMCDFHNYSFRRCTMRQWHAVQELLSNVASQRFFCLVAPKIARAFLVIASEGEESVRIKHEPRPAPVQTENDDKTIQEEEKRIAKVYKDYYLKNLDLTNPLEKVCRYVDLLLENRPRIAATYELAMDYYFRLPDVPSVLIIKCLKKLKSLAAVDRTSNLFSISIPEQQTAAAVFASKLERFKNVWENIKSATDSRIVRAVEETLSQL